MTDRELMQQALNVLKIFVDGGNSAWARKIIEIKEALRDRLAQPEQEHSEQWWRHEVSNAWAEGYEKGRASVKQPEQEPVWVEVTTNTGDKFILDSAVEADKIRAARDAGLLVVPLYTAPPHFLDPAKVARLIDEAFERGKKEIDMEQVKDIAQKLADCAVLNSAPPQRDETPAKAVEWQGLTEMEIMDICNFAKGQNGFFLVREVEAKLKEKNA